MEVGVGDFPPWPHPGPWQDLGVLVTLLGLRVGGRTTLPGMANRDKNHPRGLMLQGGRKLGAPPPPPLPNVVVSGVSGLSIVGREAVLAPPVPNGQYPGGTSRQAEHPLCERRSGRTTLAASSVKTGRGIGLAELRWSRPPS